jgi:hypothetical protein
VHNILAAVRGNLSIDATRVYAVGFSNGGGFTNLLACTASTAPLFAAFATSSPALYPGTHGMDLSTCDSGGHPVALIDFHGLSDGVVPYDGREDGNRSLPDIDAWRQGWAQRAGCAAPKNGAQFASSTTASNYLGQNAVRIHDRPPRYIRAHLATDPVPMELPEGDHPRLHGPVHGPLLAVGGRRVLGRDVDEYHGLLQRAHNHVSLLDDRLPSFRSQCIIHRLSSCRHDA